MRAKELTLQEQYSGADPDSKDTDELAPGCEMVRPGPAPHQVEHFTGQCSEVGCGTGCGAVSVGEAATRGRGAADLTLSPVGCDTGWS